MNTNYFQIKQIGENEMEFTVQCSVDDFWKIMKDQNTIFRFEIREYNKDTGTLRFSLIPDNGMASVMQMTQDETEGIGK